MNDVIDLKSYRNKKKPYAKPRIAHIRNCSNDPSPSGGLTFLDELENYKEKKVPRVNLMESWFKALERFTLEICRKHQIPNPFSSRKEKD
jgi:hypothetical protein